MLNRRNDGRFVDSDWHLFRENARQTANSPLEFAESDRVHYDLDTAGITGRDNNKNYVWDTSIDLFNINGTDVRTLEDR